MKSTTACTLVLAAAILASGAAIATALSIHTSAVQQQDYHACIIAASTTVDSSDYGAETAQNVARQCRVIVYGEG